MGSQRWTNEVILAKCPVAEAPTMPLRVDARLVGTATLAVLTFSLVASLVSVRRIARVDPVEAAGVR